MTGALLAANLMSAKNCIARLVSRHMSGSDVWRGRSRRATYLVVSSKCGVCELQGGTAVYVLTIAFVTSLLPSRFDEICAIVGVIGCVFYRETEPGGRAVHACA
jgi:hypothetical protein